MSENIYRFGDFRIDRAVRELWRGDRLIVLPPHVFDCLAYLIEHRERAIGRDELVAAVWGKTEVSDTLLGQTVLRIRRELGDDGKDPRIVRTIPRFGYCWIAAVDTVHGNDVPRSTDVAGVAVPNTNAQPPAPLALPVSGVGGMDSAFAIMSRNRSIVFLAALLAVVALAIIVRRVSNVRIAAEHGSATRPQFALAGAAVVPAGVEPGTDPEWSWLRFGVMDVVATRLRSAGLPTVPSENIIALLNAPSTRQLGSLRDVAGFRLLVTPRATQVGGGWQVHLDADDSEGQHAAVEANARDATEAARLAANKLLVVLGREAPAAVGEEEPNAQLVKRVDAAVLADDPATARALIEQAAAPQQRTPELRLRLAKIDFRGGRTSAARDRLLTLLDEAPAQTAPVLRAAVLNGLGAVAIRSDQLAAAERYFAEAVDLLAPRAEPAQLGEAYLGRAGAALDQRHFDAAMADYARARVALKQANDTLALVRVSANEGFLDLEQGRPAQALPQLVAASKGFQQWGALNEAIFTYIGQISCHLALLQATEAMEAADSAAPLAGRIENRGTLDSLTLARAKALAAVGRLREARELLNRLRDTNPRPDDVTAAAAAVPLARLELESGNAAAAARLAGLAVDALAPPGYMRMRADAWLTDVRALVRSGDATGAKAALAAFGAWTAGADDRHVSLFAELARAEYDWRFGGGDWRVDFDSARAIADESAIPADIAAAAAAYADSLLAEGDLEKAAVEVGRLSRWSDQDFDCAVREALLYAALGRDEARQSALARARVLAGERAIPKDATAIAVSTRDAAAH